MKTLTFALLTAAALGAMTYSATAQTNSPNAPGKSRVISAHTNSITATVEDIDYDKREITLKGPEGNLGKFVVSKEVVNFSQMKKGDEVKVGYYESVAVALGKKGEPLTPTSRTEALLTREPGKKPGAMEVAVTDISATVEDIDRAKREITLKGPRGNSVTLEVDPSVGDLSRINKGDEIIISHTEALAVSVEKP